MIRFFITMLILLISLGSDTFIAIAFCAWLLNKTNDRKIYDWEVDDLDDKDW